jgi:adenosylcobinamide kinase/adenosylcobinamide-phosphate guanylyltransferase
MILVTGGVRSGKSAFAERYAGRKATAGGGADVVYVATARAWDDEMVARIARHRAQRPGSWPTVEAPLDLAGALAAPPAETAGVVLVDSVDFWVSNRLLDASPVTGEQVDRRAMAALEAALLDDVAAVAASAAGPESPARTLVLVTLEAGLGVVPPSPLGRAFRDLLGRVNCAFAAAADEVYLLVAGLPLDAKRLSRDTLRMLDGAGAGAP